jgi:hypothetical protein
MEGLVTDTDKALIPLKGILVEQLANKTSSAFFASSCPICPTSVTVKCLEKTNFM